MIVEMIQNFPHKPPQHYEYSFEKFNTRYVAVYLHDHRTYDYNLGKPIRCIWGFYHPKTENYHAPINATSVGSVVNPSDTTPYSAMQLKITPLEKAFI
jgi:hypothetical protein